MASKSKTQLVYECAKVYQLPLNHDSDELCVHPQKTVDLVTFTEEIHNGKLHFLCCEEVTSALIYYIKTKTRTSQRAECLQTTWGPFLAKFKATAVQFGQEIT